MFQDILHSSLESDTIVVSEFYVFDIIGVILPFDIIDVGVGLSEYASRNNVKLKINIEKREISPLQITCNLLIKIQI